MLSPEKIDEIEARCKKGWVVRHADVIELCRAARDLHWLLRGAATVSDNANAAREPTPPPLPRP